MINVKNNFNDMIDSVAREFRGRVELLNGSTLLDIFTYDGALQSFTVEKTGANDKFFGYGVCQKATVKLRDKERKINIEKNQGLQIAYGVENDYTYTYPIFYVEEIIRDENTNDLTITAYDSLYKANSRTVSELDLPESYTLKMFITACAGLLGMSVCFKNMSRIHSMLNELVYTDNANFDGTETIREALNDAAEVLGAIYFMNNDWALTFKSLDRDGDPVLAIDKSKYFTLSVKTAHTLQNIMSVTELGDNVSSTAGVGETEYLKENAFLTLRDDIGEVLPLTLATVSGLMIYSYDLKYRGDFTLEIGDKIALTTKDDEIIETYMLGGSITYNGGLVATMNWEYTANEGEAAAANPSTIGEALSQTYARVDKAAKEIQLYVSESSTKMEEYMNESIGYINTKTAEIKLTTDAITQSVTETNERIDGTKDELESTITQTADSIRSEITAQGEVITSIQQDLDGIELTYNSENGTASITIGDITVSNLVNGEYVEETVAGIDLTGYVQFNDLKRSGSTVINGDNITTGTIDADRINLRGSISWSDLTTSCKNEIEDVAASYAGDGGNVPDYIHSTYIDATNIYSPNIYGATISAGTSSDGYIEMSSYGLNYVSESGGKLIGMGCHSNYYNFPYITFGQGVDEYNTDQGMIKKYTNGIWIGDSDAIESANPAGVGLFIDFTTGSVYFYPGTGSRVTLASP